MWFRLGIILAADSSLVSLEGATSWEGSMHDHPITGGTVVDGIGGVSVRADVGLRDGRIV